MTPRGRKVIFVLFQDMIPSSEGPLEIFVDIFIFEGGGDIHRESEKKRLFSVSKINDIELTMTFELYFDLMWRENRFVINETSDKWGPVRREVRSGPDLTPTSNSVNSLSSGARRLS